jgi:hypothetical protein
MTLSRKSIRKSIANISNQKGAMFGMDARIALIIASVLAATGSVTVMSKLERSRVEAAEIGTVFLTDAIESHYKAEGFTGSPTVPTRVAKDLDELFIKGYITETSLIADPWGNEWRYAVLSRLISIEDIELTEHLVTIHSAGKDGVNDTPSPTIAGEWNEWRPLNNDLGTKFSTIEIGKARITEYQSRGRVIVDKLQAIEEANYLEAESLCPDELWCKDIPEVKDKYTGFNFYPQSSLDTTGSPYFAEIFTGGANNIYISGDEQSMKALMKELGLPHSYSKDPWGRVMQYDSNIVKERPRPTKPPFTASIWFE